MGDEYVKIADCERTHKSDDQWKKDVIISLQELNNRLYKDNGHVSIQTRLDRGDRILGILCWVTSTAAGSVIVAAVALIIRLIFFGSAK